MKIKDIAQKINEIVPLKIPCDFMLKVLSILGFRKKAISIPRHHPKKALLDGFETEVNDCSPSPTISSLRAHAGILSICF